MYILILDKVKSQLTAQKIYLHEYISQLDLYVFEIGIQLRKMTFYLPLSLSL